jgi:hypothetical protein
MSLELILQKTRADLKRFEALLIQDPDNHEVEQIVKQLRARMDELWVKLMSIKD